MNSKETDKLVDLFKKSNQIFLDENKDLILSDVNERMQNYFIGVLYKRKFAFKETLKF
jgi:hypothetical protein